MLYGCHNGPPAKPTTRVQDGWQGWMRVMITIPVKVPTTCSHADTGAAMRDPMCAGCCWLPPAVFRSNRHEQGTGRAGDDSGKVA